MGHADETLEGYRVGLCQTRRGEALASLVQKYGGEPVSAEVLVEVELSPNPDAEELVARLEQGRVDVLLVLTGVGQRRLASQLEAHYPGAALAQAFAPLVVAARGPKAQRALRERQVRVDVVAPEPFTWDGLLEALAAHTELSGKRVAVQLYGREHPRLVASLEARGAAEVWPLWVYRWELPEDLAPAVSLIDQVLAGEVHMLLFTSAPQVDHLLRIAALSDRREPLREALARLPIGSIGPSCTECLNGHGLRPAFEPEHSKMGHLVREAARWAAKNTR